VKISIFGLGYVGSVSLGCLAQNGHTMIGVDVSEAKVASVNQGKSPIVEHDLDQIISEQRAKGAIFATTDVDKAVQETDVSFICVGTPSTTQGHLSLDGIYGVAKDIAGGIARKNSFHVVAIRSTVLPGSNQTVTEIIEKTSQKANGKDFAVVSNPEFLREGTAVKDYFNPPYTLIGSSDFLAIELMKELYKGINAPIILADIRVVELIKYVNNSFHALKICFANEVGSICKKLEIDSHELMEIFCRDTKLNIAPNYLKPGFAYGGSCLPKDLKALCMIAHDHYLKCPVLESIDTSNKIQINSVLDTILEFGKQRIGFLGLSFKEGTDDLRSSPIIDILEKLLGKGFSIRIFDKNVNISKLVGGNREFILQRIPFISRFIADDSADVVSHSDVIVVVNKEASFKELLEGLPKDKIIFDLVNIDFRGRSDYVNYRGVAW
jgi:GDP-mannose 6-dehydrogenase